MTIFDIEHITETSRNGYLSFLGGLLTLVLYETYCVLKGKNNGKLCGENYNNNTSNSYRYEDVEDNAQFPLRSLKDANISDNKSHNLESTIKASITKYVPSSEGYVGSLSDESLSNESTEKLFYVNKDIFDNYREQTLCGVLLNDSMEKRENMELRVLVNKEGLSNNMFLVKGIKYEYEGTMYKLGNFNQVE